MRAWKGFIFPVLGVHMQRRYLYIAIWADIYNPLGGITGVRKRQKNGVLCRISDSGEGAAPKARAAFSRQLKIWKNIVWKISWKVEMAGIQWRMRFIGKGSEIIIITDSDAWNESVLVYWQLLLWLLWHKKPSYDIEMKRIIRFSGKDETRTYLSYGMGNSAQTDFSSGGKWPVRLFWMQCWLHRLLPKNMVWSCGYRTTGGLWNRKFVSTFLVIPGSRLLVGSCGKGPFGCCAVTWSWCAFSIGKEKMIRPFDVDSLTFGGCR